MTFKTLLIAVLLVAGFTGFMMLTWSISERMMREPVAETEQKAPINGKKPERIEANTVGPEDDTEAEPAKQDKAEDPQEVETGAYDDTWSGTELPKATNGLTPTTQPKAPASTPTIGNSAAPTSVDPYQADDREAAAEEPAAEPQTPSSSQNADPYRGDDREGN